MNLEKAIEILDDLTKGCEPPDPQDLDNALKLGIEALRCVQKVRQYPFPDEILLLPGETEC